MLLHQARHRLGERVTYLPSRPVPDPQFTVEGILVAVRGDRVLVRYPWSDVPQETAVERLASTRPEDLRQLGRFERARCAVRHLWRWLNKCIVCEVPFCEEHETECWWSNQW
jgi:hypothetical protein